LAAAAAAAAAAVYKKSPPSTTVPTVDSILADQVFDHVLDDVRALQRNDLKLACLMAVYCEEFCSCEQLKQVLRGDALTVPAACYVCCY
jgi:hypothetical protein